MNSYNLLFDLDGTLINTDFVYLDVWKKLLNTYNISINKEFFDNFIKGKSDVTFLNYLLPQLTNEDIQKYLYKKIHYLLKNSLIIKKKFL